MIKCVFLLALTGFETCNKFTVKNSLGQKVYYAVEDTDCLTRNCCGPLRPFDMKILDNYKNEVIHLHRPLACDSCCFPCCLQVRNIHLVCIDNYFFLHAFVILTANGKSRSQLELIDIFLYRLHIILTLKSYSNFLVGK